MDIIPSIALYVLPLYAKSLPGFEVESAPLLACCLDLISLGNA